ncbi:hypothetical protein GR157_00530 [Burkholderia sp. 4701]|nr:hypothetical protein [Burkholderia sp. 4701]MXN83214.1 hypothetical protein [Burkholderia sp. 4812]
MTDRFVPLRKQACRLIQKAFMRHTNSIHLKCGAPGRFYIRHIYCSGRFDDFIALKYSADVPILRVRIGAIFCGAPSGFPA